MLLCPLLGILSELFFFSLSGNLGDVVLGYDTIAEYVVSSQTRSFSSINPLFFSDYYASLLCFLESTVWSGLLVPELVNSSVFAP